MIAALLACYSGVVGSKDSRVLVLKKHLSTN
jgi:hypothetical protein